MCSGKSNAAECPVCLEVYQTDGPHMPYVLNCAHTLCHSCIQTIKKTDNKTGAHSWRCPTCQCTTTQEPKPNFGLRDLIPSLSQMRVEPSPSAAPCEECADAKATLWCQTCEIALCESCMDAVHKMKSVQRHTRVPVSEREKTQGPPKCPTHGEVPERACLVYPSNL
jgi:hypothetical protein